MGSSPLFFSRCNTWCVNISDAVILGEVYFSVGTVTITAGIAFGFLDPTLTNHLEDVTNVSTLSLTYIKN